MTLSGEIVSKSGIFTSEIAIFDFFSVIMNDIFSFHLKYIKFYAFEHFLVEKIQINRNIVAFLVKYMHFFTIKNSYVCIFLGYYL